ncbi:MAG: hypothetical protein EZS28_017271 [Streblomastix strix]|uniref:Uncharacterized protein n=1 Tax=Streblomastix strix TaxID=222440 RepID=A0A5J4VXF6_9EUKA|nr:MAG: hypothetical protein EZS28_017271 [Streblomastix strix]
MPFVPNWPRNISVFYITKDGLGENDCQSPNTPCDFIETVIIKYINLTEYQFNIDDDVHMFSLILFKYFPEPSSYKESACKIAILGIEGTILKLVNTYDYLESCQFYLQNLTLDLSGLELQLEKRKSLVELTNVIVIRNGGNTAINSESNIMSSDGIVYLNNILIDGEGKTGEQTLFYIENVIAFILNNSLIQNIRKSGEDQNQTLMYVEDLKSGSVVAIENTTIQNTYTGSIHGQLILAKFNWDIFNYTTSNGHAFIIKGSTFINNNNFPQSNKNSAVIILIDVKSQLLKLENNKFDNVKIKQINVYDYEVSLTLAEGTSSDDVIQSFEGNTFVANMKPIIVYEFESKHPITFLAIPQIYAQLKVSSKTGNVSCIEYDDDYTSDIKTLSCAMIVIRGQDKEGQLQNESRMVLVDGEFDESDMRTDGLIITFYGNQHQSASSLISFKPNLYSDIKPPKASYYNDESNNIIDNSLFRVTNGGQLNLDSIQVTRIRSFIGAEEIPIVSVVPESGKYGEISSIPGILTLTNSIISGSGSFADKWSGKGIELICNIEYAPLIVASSSGKVQLIGTTVTQSEGAGIYASGGTQLSVDSKSSLDSNGERVGSSLSGMQTNVVCDGININGTTITTSIEINSNSLPSYTLNNETWVFADISKGCISIIITNTDGEIVSHYSPVITKGSITISSDDSGSKAVKIIVSGIHINPCDRILYLELRDEMQETNQFIV